MRRFAGSAAGTAAGVALLAAASVPLLRRLDFRGGSAVAVMTPVELWLLEVFTAGALAVLLGLAALGGWWLDPRGVRDAAEREGRTPDAVGKGGAEGGSRDADEDGPAVRRPERNPGRRSGRGGAAGAWLTSVGGLLLAIYAAGWVATR